MGLSDVAGIFSRKFIVGFFVPVFFAGFALSRLVDSSALPTSYRQAGDATQVLVVGACAVLVGLLLSGLHLSLIGSWRGTGWSGSASPRRMRRRAHHCSDWPHGT